MKIAYYAMLRDITGTREEDWGQPAASVAELLHGLIARYGDRFARWVLEQGQLTLAIVLVNGRDVRGLQGLSTPLAPTDHVMLFPPVAGG